MLHPKLFEMVDVILENPNCSSLLGLQPWFDGFYRMASGYYLQLLPMCPSNGCLEDEDWTGWYVKVRQLEELHWASRLKHYVTVCRMETQARQRNNSLLWELLARISKITDGGSPSLFIKLTCNIEEARGIYYVDEVWSKYWKLLWGIWFYALQTGLSMRKSKRHCKPFVHLGLIPVEQQTWRHTLPQLSVKEKLSLSMLSLKSS